MATKHPARQISWWVVDSSNVTAVGYDSERGMFVRFTNDRMYLYHDVSRQQAVACAMHSSVGAYINREIKPHFKCTRVV